MHPPRSPTAAARRWNPWQAFRRRHLHDYPPAAAALWLAIVLSGTGALAWQLWRLQDLAGASPLLAVVTAVGLAAAASLFSVRLPRTSHAVSAADIFIFGALLATGPAAATLAAGIDGYVGTRRSSKRLSSWLASPAAAMAAMTVTALAFETLQGAAMRGGFGAEGAAFGALCVVAVLPWAGTTLPLMAVMALKRSAPLQPLDWLAGSSWMGALFLFAACFAGLVHLGAQRFGNTVLVVSVTVVFALVLLLRASLARQEREHAAQQARVEAAEREAALNHERFTAAFTHAAIGMAVVRESGQTLKANLALAELLVRRGDSMLGQPFLDFVHGGDRQLFQRQVQQVLDAPDHDFSMELRMLRGDEAPLWTAVHCSRFADPDGSGHGLIYQVLDITSRQQAEQRLHHIAYHDTLTDLANRLHFQEQLALAVERSRTQDDVRFAVLFIDLDRFKMVNDSFGHHAGNELLCATAERLKGGVRPADLVARLGGDEFAVLLDGLHDKDAGLKLAERLLASISRPIEIAGSEVLPGASLGITFSDLGYRTVDEILRDADLAMYEAKGGGRGRVAVFDQSMHDKVAQRLALENDLRRAIGEGQLSLQFQPLYELQGHRLAGFEALARWMHPQRGAVSPAVFIAVAEESDLITALTDWVIEQAIAQLAGWRRTRGAGAQETRGAGAQETRGAGPQEARAVSEPLTSICVGDAPQPLCLEAAPDSSCTEGTQESRCAHAARGLTLAVNISSRDLARPSLVDHVRQVLARHGVPATALTLEITESTLMARLDAALHTMRTLREDGVRFSIDDFGTGYSSLAYLGTLPIDTLKIDRSFVAGLERRPQDREIVRTIAQLGHTLGRKVVAEGIETPEQLAALRSMGVDLGQGYLLSRPLPAEQVPALLVVEQAAGA
ncbi:MAG: EAL domain-containing protein [Rubrivivax sp.]|nr:EAL domain-containing protein [Rubrivivax sp.]